MKRREFVQVTGAAVATGLVAGCGNDVGPAPILPAALKPTPSGQLLVALKTVDGKDHYPDLAPIGGAITIPIDTGGGAFPQAILLVHLSDAPTDPLRYTALNSSCPHAGCPLGFSQKDLMVECPCHGSRFAVSAGAGAGGSACPTVAVNNPPALSAPTAYAVALSADGSLLTISLNAGATLKFADHPALMNPGGVAVSECPPVVVVRKDASTVVAFSAICTHLQCLVGTDGKDILCPCHGSRFDQSGNPINGPATRPLPMLTATLQADGVKIG